MDIKLVVAALLLGSIQLSTQNRCMSETLDGSSITPWSDLQSKCRERLQNQIQMELEASITYLAMSAHYSHASTHRPGVAKFFLDSAVEEREHAKKLIEYLLMRGGQIGSETIRTITQPESSWSSLETALSAALKLEKQVTTSIKDIIKVCGAEAKENDTTVPQQDNDYHAVDYLTGEFLTEQHEGTRTIAGYLATLKKMTALYGNFAELMFDKSLNA